MIKNFLKKITDQQQRHRLCLLCQQGQRGVTSFFEWLVNGLLPCRLKVFLKEHIHVRMPVDYKKEKISIDISSSLERAVRTISCAKEPETVAWIEGYFQEGEMFLDIGANIGAYSLVAAKYHKGRVAVYAVEPSAFNFSQLCRNIELNKCGDVIVPMNIALARRTAVGNFDYQNLTAGGALHSLGGGVAPAFSQSIMSFTIDDLVNIFHLPVPNHIKLDVDGLEMEILQGSPQVFNSGKVRSMLVEIGDQDDVLLRYIQSLGFVIDGKYPQGHGSALSNYVFKKQKGP